MVSTKSNFENSMNYWLDHELPDPWLVTFREKALSKTDLGGGEEQYFYADGACEYTVVINSKSQRVLSWDYSSAPEKCAMSNCSAW